MSSEFRILHRTAPFLAVLALSACQSTSNSEGTQPLAMSTDLNKQTVASASCTRGNSPAAMTVGRNGAATGRIVGSRGRSFAGSMVARDARTVVLTIEEGAINNDRLEEAMTITQEGAGAVLKGATFTCKDVRVRTG